MFNLFIHITYAGELNKSEPYSKSVDIVNSHSNIGIQSFVSLITNQSNMEGIELAGNVTHVVDGDTLDINGIRVRLTLVDTPERGQPGFREAKEFVNILCLGKKGELDIDDGQRRGDRYGREIGIVYCDEVNINEKLMDEGLARILTDYCEISEFSQEGWAKAACNLT